MMLRARAGRSHLGLNSSLQANFMRNLSAGAIANLPTFKTSDIYRDGRLTLRSLPVNVSTLEIASEIRVAILCLSCWSSLQTMIPAWLGCEACSRIKSIRFSVKTARSFVTAARVRRSYIVVNYRDYRSDTPYFHIKSRCIGIINLSILSLCPLRPLRLNHFHTTRNDITRGAGASLIYCRKLPRLS
jgi:hypothetical protein